MTEDEKQTTTHVPIHYSEEQISVARQVSEALAVLIELAKKTGPDLYLEGLISVKAKVDAVADASNESFH